ncbi:MFS transporter [Halalkalicoccus jeotgali]|uniref:Major facilitator superfamily MFS_1 n=1 Tax=Halalkalicoccus jeotgali (strain DSM 18796 / CECT 7217 / JCM 14584 / KCTC 4019 / B3) TaxID=795797 RepID=D8J8N9_HALJB|nr:MFS transporter [Halalkalicoccus jeotgali]ADJ14224.1 major facilitator superfamily MFS_1 [Halalkalicoccus jeotgali B3]ELY34595.1 major facilitator superfamily protein [Halalkalicoccus jeotgali B3]
MERRTRWTAAIFLFVALDAASLQIRGALLPQFEATFSVPPGLLGLVAPAGTAGFFLTVLVVGLAAGRIRVHRTLLLGVLGAGAFLLVMSGAPVYPLFLGALVCHGVSLGGFRALDRALLSHLYPERRGRIFTLHGLAWAIGAVSGPALAALVIWVADWRAVFVVLGLGFLPVGLSIRNLPLPERMANERPISVDGATDLFRDPAILGMTGALLLVGGIEGAIFTWLPYYAGTSLPAALAPLALSAYLLAYVPGRITYTVLAERVGYAPLSLALALPAIPAMYVALVATEGYAMLAAVFVLGLFMSGQFPLLSAVGVEAASEYSGPVNAISTSATYVGMAIVPTVMGVITETDGIASAMLVPVVLVVGASGLIGATWLATYRE